MAAYLRLQPERDRRVPVALLLGCALGLALVTSQRASEWATSQTLWAAAARVNPASPHVLWMRAVMQWQAGEFDDARSQLAQAQAALQKPGRPDRQHSPLWKLVAYWTTVLDGASSR